MLEDREWARVVTATLVGLRARRVHVEVDLAPTLPGFTLVGLPSASLRESRDRIGSALRHAGFHWPDRRITVGLAPADVRKDGAVMDLAIATGILLASGQVARPPGDRLRRTLFLGELALDGVLRPVAAAAPLGLDATSLGVDRVVLPDAQAAVLAPELDVPCVGLAHLSQLGGVLARLPAAASPPRPRSVPADPAPDLSGIRGQARAKRALVLAAAGGHHLALQGPPGCGKTMLARCLVDWLPPLDREARRQQLRIHGAAGRALDPSTAHRPPLRAPHHSVTVRGLLGGGTPLRPGEVTLAHGGVLLLDEAGEFGANRLEQLREPLSSGVIRLSRGGHTVEFPAGFQLVLTTNPCPCGYLGSRARACACRRHQIDRYRRRLSGPLCDRIDLWVDMDREPAARLLESPPPGPDVADVWRVRRAPPVEDGLQELAPDLARLATDWADRLGLSARGLTRALRVAGTIARVDGRGGPDREALAEALSFRRVDPG